ncbi:MAG: DHHA1 domain-containing protein [Caldilineaceae bacterium]
MTNRLYYTDSYRTEFAATVVESPNIDGLPATVLNETFFYPTSGGQPHDMGLLGGQPVVDVRAEDGRIIHVLDNGAHTLAPGQIVQGQIDWPRRFDHMQQHSAQHLLSYVFDNLYDFETISVHFGATESTLDLATAAVSASQLRAAEQFANQLVYDNLPITAYFVDESAIAHLPLRRPPKVSGQIRIVEIEQRDYSACGGTHCSRTGELGLIRLTRQERSRGNVRITFVSGWRALRDSLHKHDLITQVAALFSTDMDSAPELVQRALEQNKAFERALDILHQQLMRFEARELFEKAVHVGDYRVVSTVLYEQPPENVRVLAAHLQEEARLIICLATVVSGKLTLICARSADVKLHMGNLLRDALKQLGGGGGGRPDFAQGGGVDSARADELMAYLMADLQRQTAGE